MAIADAVHKRDDGTIDINIFPRQREFLSTDVDDALYGGAAGGGKSAAILLFCIKRRMEHPGTSGIAFRRTFGELDQSLILESRQLFTKFGATYNEQKKLWTFPNGSTQFFGYCDKDGDVYRYQSANFHDICFDELTHFNEFQFKYLTSRCRSTIPGVKAIIRSATNPGNVGHHWVWKRYIEPYQMNKIWTNPITKKTLTFIPAKIADNPAIYENDPGYIERLRELPEKKYLALADGRWDVFEGAYFTEWDATPGQSVLSYSRTPDTYTTKFLSLDWGFADPACVLWFEVTPMGRVFVYRQLYVTRQSPKELAKLILENSPEDERYMYMAASPEIWGKRVETDEGGEAIQALLQTGLGDRIVMQKANNARIPGWLKVREYFSKAPDGFPWLQISPLCRDLVRTIPTLIHDDRSTHAEDVDGKCEDHSAEALRYGVMTLTNVPRSTIVGPHMTGYEKIFGRSIPNEGNVANIPIQGRSGYGR